MTPYRSRLRWVIYCEMSYIVVNFNGWDQKCRFFKLGDIFISRMSYSGSLLYLNFVSSKIPQIFPTLRLNGRQKFVLKNVREAEFSAIMFEMCRKFVNFQKIVIFELLLFCFKILHILHIFSL
jgi:hypothetical protein